MKKGDKSDLTQSEANDLFSYGSFILPLKFANIITVVTVCAFYTKLIPIAPFLGMLSLVF
jgi:ABC-type multidrug transport system permease subunit